MWAALLKQLVYAFAQGVLTFLWDKYNKLKLKKNKEALDKKIDDVEKKVYQNEKDYLDDLSDIDTKL
jgi:L-rhamnose isomerase